MLYQPFTSPSINSFFISSRITFGVAFQTDKAILFEEFANSRIRHTTEKR
jgi:hypothetical protein